MNATGLAEPSRAIDTAPGAIEAIDEACHPEPALLAKWSTPSSVK